MLSWDYLLAGTWWIQLFEKWSPNFPASHASQNEWTTFVLQCSPVPASFILVGLFISFAVLCCSCVHLARIRNRSPSFCPMLCMMFLTILLAGAGTVSYWATGSEMTQIASREIDHAVHDTTTVDDGCTNLQQSGQDLNKILNDAPAQCPQEIKAKVQQYVKIIGEHVKTYTVQVQGYSSILKPYLHDMGRVQNNFQTVAVYLIVSLLAPSAFIFICCITLFGLAVCSNRGNCGRCLIRLLGPLFFFPAVLIVTIAIAIQLEIGIVTGSFCKQVDTNSLIWIEHFTSAQSYNVSHYYITNQGQNPILEKLNAIETQITTFNAEITKYGNLLSASCPSWKDEDRLTETVKSMQTDVTTGKKIVSRENVYPYYDKLVHEDACKTMVVTIGWLVLLEVLVGFFCLPCLTMAATRYLRAIQCDARQPVYFNDHPQLVTQMQLLA